jgi:ATP-dependent DNA helicase RecG
VLKLLELLARHGPLGNDDIRQAFVLKDRRRLRETYLAPALADGLIEYTLPDKPNSRLQQYRLTAQGKALLK